jgi:hypothetical protein
LAATLAACGGAHHAAHPGPAGEARPASVGDGSAWRINHLPALGVTFGNDLIAITFDGQSGRITQIEDRRRDPRLRLLDPSLDLTGVPPLALEEIKKIPLFNKYKIQPVDLPDRQPTFSRASDRLTLRWDYPAPLPAVEAEWRLTADAPELRVFVRVILRDQRMIYRVHYPLVAGLAPLSRTQADGDQFLNTHEGGLLLSDPLHHLLEDDGGASGLSDEYYPDGHGAMAQMIAYLHPGVGGLLIYTPDADSNGKWFSLRNRSTDNAGSRVLASLEVAHQNPDVTDSGGTHVFAPAYPTVLRWLDRGDWADAAEVYRQWSDQQTWASRPIAQRDPAEREFFERLGASIFGLSARVDQQAWIRAFHQELIDGLDPARLLFVLGWDFHPMGDPEEDAFTAFSQGGWNAAHWSPLMGASPQNIALAQTLGDWVMPFLYDDQVFSGYPGWTGYDLPGQETGTPWSSHVQVDEKGRPGGFVYWNPHFPGLSCALCLADPITAQFYHWRDRLLIGLPDLAFDGLYFDVGFSVANRGCYPHFNGANHHHPSGGGAYLVRGARKALAFDIGAPIPRGFRFGAENVDEPYIDLVDFWHLGSPGAGPYRDRLGAAVGAPTLFAGADRWIMNGAAVEAPLMAYLDHHNGAVRTGGKMQISQDVGEAFYWVVGAEYLWGGVVELIYFNTGVDWLPAVDAAATGCEQTPCAFETAFGQGNAMPRGWSYGADVRLADPDKIAYLREAIDLRVTSPAAPYLSAGRMAPPPPLDPEPAPVAYDYDYYSSLFGPDYQHAGVWRAAPVIHTAWRHPHQNTVALLLANTSDQTLSVDLAIDPALYGMAAANVARIDLHAGAGRAGERWATIAGRTIEPVTLQPREFAMFELSPVE